MTPRPEPGQTAGQRILITGGTGFLGQHLSRSLETLGCEVHCVSRAAHTDVHGPIHWWQANVEDMHELTQLWDIIEPTVVYHLSGAVDGAPRLDLLLPTYHSLLTTTVNLLQLSTERACRRVVLIGSLEETEAQDAAAPPSSPYAAAKSAAGEYARMCHQLFGTNVVILRTFMTYGFGQPAWKLIPATIRALLDGRPPEISSGRRLLDWVYVDDVTEAFVMAAFAPKIDGIALDIGTGRLTSIREVVEHLVRLIDPMMKPQYGVLPDRPERPPRTANVGQTLKLLGWSPRTSLEEGLKRTVQAYRGGL